MSDTKKILVRQYDKHKCNTSNINIPPNPNYYNESDPKKVWAFL